MATLDLPIPQNEQATEAVEFINSLKHYESNLLAEAGEHVQLQDWQEAIIRLLFGTLDEGGKRRFKTLFLFIAKKNSKSWLCAMIAIYLLTKIKNGSIVAIAANTKQAANIFDPIFKTVREMGWFDSDLARYNKNSREIEYLPTGCTYTVRATDVDKLDGVKCNVAIIDELHRLTKYGPECWKILQNATINYPEPLFICMTTAGGTREEFTYEKYQYAKSVLEGEIEDSSFLPVVYEAAEELSIDDEQGWRNANPAIDSGFLAIDMFRQFSEVAKTSLNEEYKFRRFNLNQFTMVEAAWIPLDKWDAITEVVDEQSLIGLPGYWGLDVGINRSMTALVGVIERDDKYYLICRAWLPLAGIDKQSEKDQIDYRQWEKEGLIKLLPGETIHQESVIRDILDLHKVYPMRELAVDPMNGLGYIQAAEDAGIIAYQHRQGYAESNYPCLQFYKAILDGRLVHGGNKVLRAHVQNAVIITNHDGLIKLSKKRSKGFSADGQKTDSVCAAVMALGRACCNKQDDYDWENEELIFV